jgi:hypothetical protein
LETHLLDKESRESFARKGSGRHGSDPNILFTISMPAAVVAQPQTTSSLMEEVAAPSQLASAGGSGRQITPRTWNVPQHLALETFLYSSGPPEISRYNFNFVMRRIKDQFVRRMAYEAGGKHSPAHSHDDEHSIFSKFSKNFYVNSKGGIDQHNYLHNVDLISRFRFFENGEA